MSIKKAGIIIGIVAVVGAGAAFALTRKAPVDTYTTETVAMGKIVQTVSETGTVKSQDELALNFQTGGKVGQVLVKVGDQVAAGQALAELDLSDLTIKRKEAQANLEVSRQNYLKLQSGATSEDVAIAKASAQQAKVSYSTSQNELDKLRAVVAERTAQAEKTLSDLESDSADNVTPAEQSVKTAQSNLDNIKTTLQKTVDDLVETGRNTAADKNAVAKTALDAINKILTDQDAKDQLSQKNPVYKSQTQADYNSAVLLYATAKEKADAALLNVSADKTQAALGATNALLGKTFSALNNCFSALENSITNSLFTQTELDTFKSTISSHQTLVAAAVSAAQSAKQSLDTAVLNLATKTDEYGSALSAARAAFDNALKEAKNAATTAKLSGEREITAQEARVNTAYETYLVAQAQYTRTIAAADQHDLALYQARITQAQAALDVVDKAIKDARLTAPIAGTVTGVNYEAGEQFVPSGAKPMIAMLGKNDYEIELLISEADIAKIKVGDPVGITLDSYGEDLEFPGQVAFIEPAETVVQDVIYYKTTIDFDPGETTVKSGMTANAIITTAEKENVVVAPLRAILDRNGSGKFIRVLENGVLAERQVTIGLRGDEGMVEVISGVNPGETVVTYVKAAK